MMTILDIHPAQTDVAAAVPEVPAAEPRVSRQFRAAVDAVTSAGFARKGSTQIETFRVGTAAAPVFGGIGGKLVTVGGRAKFAHPSGWFVTVGPRTVNFYVIRNGGACGFVNFRTTDTDGIVAWLVTEIGGAK